MIQTAIWSLEECLINPRDNWQTEQGIAVIGPTEARYCGCLLQYLP